MLGVSGVGTTAKTMSALIWHASWPDCVPCAAVKLAKVDKAFVDVDPR